MPKSEEANLTVAKRAEKRDMIRIASLACFRSLNQSTQGKTESEGESPATSVASALVYIFSLQQKSSK